jgi:hypothetical protein
MDLAKRVLVDLQRSLKECEDSGRRQLSFKRLDPFDFVSVKKAPTFSPKSVSRLWYFTPSISADTFKATRKYDGLFDSAPTIQE